MDFSKKLDVQAMSKNDVVNLGTGWATVFYRKWYCCNLCLDHVRLLFEALAVWLEYDCLHWRVRMKLLRR